MKHKTVSSHLQDFAFLGAHSLFLGALPLFIVWLASRTISDESLAFFVQSWLVFNLVNLSVFGTLEALIPALLRKGHAARDFRILFAFSLLISFGAWGLFLGSIGDPPTVADTLGLLAATTSYGLHAVARGYLISSASWKKLALVTLIQIVVTISALTANLAASDFKVNHVFLSLSIGYLSLFLLAPPKERQISRNHAHRSSANSGIKALAGLSASSALINLVPTLPGLVAGYAGLTANEILILAAAPFLSRAGIAVTNSVTPWFLQRNAEVSSEGTRDLWSHLLLLLGPSVAATAVMALAGKEILGTYLGIPIEVPVSSFLLVSAAEGLVAATTAFRTRDMARALWISQLFTWSSGVLSFFLVVGILGAPTTESLGLSLFFSALIVLVLQMCIAWKREG